MDSVLLYQSNLQATSSNAQSNKSRRKKKITIWKSDFSKVADSQFTWKVKIYSFFKNIFPFLAHYGIFMISSILHVTWNYMLLILCASLSLYTLLTWRKTAINALLSIGLMGRPCHGLFIVWVPKAKAKPNSTLWRAKWTTIILFSMTNHRRFQLQS